MLSMYNASKWAVEGFTEAISKEIKPEWNIKVTCVEPGGFRCVRDTLSEIKGAETLGC